MKNTLSALTLSCCLATSAVQADTLLGVYIGGQAWDMDTSGGFANTSNLTEFGYGGETVGSYYLAFEHFVPLIPNAKVQYAEMDTSGSTLLSDNFTFAGELYAAGSQLNTDIAMTNTDFILYYEFFDNDLVSFDFGLNGKYLDGSFAVQEQASPNRASSQDFSGVVPMLYGRIAFGLPFTGLGVYAEGSFLSFEHSIYDYQAAVTYSFIESMAVDMSLQLGYRAMLLELDDLDSIDSDMEYDGVFAGLEFHF